jgi:hypothetical protein
MTPAGVQLTVLGNKIICKMILSMDLKFTLKPLIFLKC